jgi:predicted lysophospholipase L1 biosynthesis ABC-type transport system permease subunit
MVYLLKMVIFHSYVNVYQRVIKKQVPADVPGKTKPMIHGAQAVMAVVSLAGSRLPLEEYHGLPPVRVPVA